MARRRNAAATGAEVASEGSPPAGRALRANSTDPRAERTRTAIKSAALALARERRIEAIGVFDIVERAGVSRPAFYLHFTDRDDAVATSVRESLLEAMAAVDGALEPEGVFRKVLELARAEYVLYENLYPGVAAQRSADALRALLRPPCEALAGRLLASGRCRAGLRVELVAMFLLGALIEVLRQPVATGPQPHEAVEALLALVGEPLAPS